MLSVHEARRQIEDVKYLDLSSDDDMNKAKDAVVKKAKAATSMLDKVHNILMHSFDNKWEIVLHKARVSFWVAKLFFNSLTF